MTPENFTTDLGSLEEKHPPTKISTPRCCFWIHQDDRWRIPSFHPSILPSLFPGVASPGWAKVQAGAEIDHGPVTPLHLAARHGHLEACKASFFFFFFRMDKLGGMNILLMVQKSGKNQWIWYSLSHYLQGFTVYIPGGWPWDFWLPSTVFWRGATIIEKVGHPKSLRVETKHLWHGGLHAESPFLQKSWMAWNTYCPLMVSTVFLVFQFALTFDILFCIGLKKTNTLSKEFFSKKVSTCFLQLREILTVDRIIVKPGSTRKESSRI